jgi:hypothetical protein
MFQCTFNKYAVLTEIHFLFVLYTLLYPVTSFFLNQEKYRFYSNFVLLLFNQNKILIQDSLIPFPVP